MPEDNNKAWLLDQLLKVTEFIREGRLDEIDLDGISAESPQLALNLESIIRALELAGRKISLDTLDLPIINDHIDHVSKSTEAGVLTVLNTADTIMEKTTQAMDVSERLLEDECVKGNEILKDEIAKVDDIIASVQNHCFGIITSLEFEDANRQLLNKLLTRLNETYVNLMELLMLLRSEDKLETMKSDFLENLKRIIDLEGRSRQSQESVDELFEDFGS